MLGTMWLLLVEIVCVGIVHGLEWQSLPDDYIYACAGSKVTLPWRFEVTAEEDVVSVNWIHDGSMTSTMVATSVRHHFVPTSGYGARVQRVDNGGLVLNELVVEDSGNYTVEVNVALTGGLFRSFQKTVYLQVADGLMLQGQLKAEQDPGAWWDQSSRQWFLRLTCGSFNFLGPPPVHLDWTTPDGESQPSSGYESGQFYLSLATPVQGGEYTCSIPPARLPDLCYKEEGGQDLSALSASVTLDETKARLSLLEANQKTLREDREGLLTHQNTLLEDNERLQEKLRSLQQTHVQDMQNATEYCRGVLSKLKSRMDDMQNVQQSLQDKAEHLYNRSQAMAKKVLDAALTGPCRSDSYTEIDDAWRSSSEGQDELHCDNNLEPGWYRFYLDGQNAVMPVECVPKNHCHTHAPQWLNLKEELLPEVGEEKEGVACAHWDSDCCHWQSPVTVRNCGGFFVYKLQPGDDCHLAYCVELQK